MKKQSGPCSGFLNPRLLIGLVFCLAGTLLGIALLYAAPDQSTGISAGSNTHTTGNNNSGQQAFAMASPMNTEEIAATLASTAPTRSTFVATWSNVAGAVGYRLDVSKSSSFSSYLPGYENLDVGNTIGTTVTGLSPGTTYYYRVRAFAGEKVAVAASQTTVVTTVAASGLIIHPTFDRFHYWQRKLGCPSSDN